MLRRTLRVAFVAVAVLTGLCAAVVVGVWIWLRTDSGQRFVVERLRAPLRAAGVDLDTDRVSGTFFSSMSLHGLTLRLCEQKIAVHARSVEVRYGLLSVLRGAPVLTVTVLEPVVNTIEDGACRVVPGGDGPSLPRRVVLRRLEVHQGVAGSLTAIEILGDGVLERGPGGAPAVTFHLEKAAARIFPAPSDSHVELSGQLAAERVDVELTAALTRDDLERHAAGAVAAGPVAVRAKVAGPLGALDIEAHVTTALGEVDVSGTVSAPGRRADLALATKRMVIAPAGSDVEIAASAKVRAQASVDEKRAVHVTLRGHGDYTRRGFDPSLPGAAMRRYAEKLPGGSWSGSGEASADGDGVATRFRIDLSSDGKREEAATASVVLSGKLVVPRAGRPRLEASVTPRETAPR